jgi:hypothetical protein
MARPLVRSLSLCLLLCGCGDTHRYDINCPLMWPDNPIVVKLPYQEMLNKGGLRLSIRAIPGRTDAVQVVAKMSGFYESPVVEWTQEGCSTKKLPLDKELERYDFEFHELRAAEDSVAEVKLSVVFRSKSGSR